MKQVDYDLEKELLGGNFEQLNLDYWFKTYQYNYIDWAIRGCDKVINREVLEFIVKYAQLLLLCPNEDNKHKSCDIIYNCEYLLTQVIIVASKHYDEYRYIVLDLFQSDSEMVRLYCHANLPVLWCSFNESSNRINKVRYLRQEFSYCWNENLLNNTSKEKILFFVKALEYKVINCICHDFDLEYAPIQISSLLLEDDIYISRFDIDVLHTIQDKRILGYCLSNLYEDGYLKFKEDIKLPSCLIVDSFASSLNKMRIKRPNAIKRFDEIYTIKN